MMTFFSRNRRGYLSSNNVFRLRLFLDFAAVILIIACLAYWWLDNLSHELFGAALFALIIAHNVFNRRWYGSVSGGRHDCARVFNIIIIAGLALVMLILLVTSVLISRDLFAFMDFNVGYGVREIHMFAGYWFLLILGVHLGGRWAVVMIICRGVFGIMGQSLVRMVALRCAAGIVILWGVKSCFAMTFGSKLTLTYTLDMWDFNESTWEFFINYASITGLFAAITHYALCLNRIRAKPRSYNTNSGDRI